MSITLMQASGADLAHRQVLTNQKERTDLETTMAVKSKLASQTLLQPLGYLGNCMHLKSGDRSKSASLPVVRHCETDQVCHSFLVFIHYSLVLSPFLYMHTIYTSTHRK